MNTWKGGDYNMTWVTYKKRNSENYKFSTNFADDPQIVELREMLKRGNKNAQRWNKSQRLAPSFFRGKYNNYRYVWVRPRGPRDGDTHDTPLKNATHFDVYVRTKCVYE